MPDSRHGGRTGGRPRRARKRDGNELSDPAQAASLSAIFELQGRVGRLEGKIDKLSEQADRQQRTIDWMRWALFIAAGALVILGPMVTWILDNLNLEQILSLLAKGG